MGVREDMEVSWNRGIPKSSILSGFSIQNNIFWGTPICRNPWGAGFIPFFGGVGMIQCTKSGQPLTAQGTEACYQGPYQQGRPGKLGISWGSGCERVGARVNLNDIIYISQLFSYSCFCNIFPFVIFGRFLQLFHFCSETRYGGSNGSNGFLIFSQETIW